MKKRARGHIVVGFAELERDFSCSTSTSWSGELAASCVPVRVRAACVLVLLTRSRNSGHRACTPTKTPRRSFLPGNSGQRSLLTQPLNYPY